MTDHVHTRYEELPQVTDNYVVHARGFTIGDDVWLDQYALYGGHNSWWNTELSNEYNEDEYIGDWSVIADSLDVDTMYWSITGSGTLIINQPLWPLENEDIDVLTRTVDALQIPQQTNVTVEMEDGYHKTTVRDILQ